MQFDPTMARTRVEKMWTLAARFGFESDANEVYLNEWVSDRYALVNGMQLLRDELQFATASKSDIFACGADLGIPSVVSTLAHTNCGDRIHQGESTCNYQRVVAARFATLAELGDLKLEAFSPTGGGTDDGATLAHVTVAHQIDEPLREKVYSGHPASFIFVCLDLKTHVGRMDLDERTHFGRTQESPWREPRAACGAIVGTLSNYNENNAVHRRIRSDLGEENFEYLSKNRIMSEGGTDITASVASSIVAIQGMRNTANALAHELDERGLAHLTASTTINRVTHPDHVLYLARATVFGGEIRTQGLGTDARKYSGKMKLHGAEWNLCLSYDGHPGDQMPVDRVSYPVRTWKKGAAH